MTDSWLLASWTTARSCSVVRIFPRRTKAVGAFSNCAGTARATRSPVAPLLPDTTKTVSILSPFRRGRVSRKPRQEIKHPSCQPDGDENKSFQARYPPSGSHEHQNEEHHR